MSQYVASPSCMAGPDTTSWRRLLRTPDVLYASNKLSCSTSSPVTSTIGDHSSIRVLLFTSLPPSASSDWIVVIRNEWWPVIMATYYYDKTLSNEVSSEWRRNDIPPSMPVWQRLLCEYCKCACPHSSCHYKGRNNELDVNTARTLPVSCQICRIVKQEAFEKKCWAHSPLRAAALRLFYIACHSPGVATVARRLRIDVHNNDDNDNAWQRGPLWPHRIGPISTNPVEASEPSEQWTSSVPVKISAGKCLYEMTLFCVE